jgi:PII-like signaling protein
LVDVIDGMMEIFDYAMEEVSEEEVAAEEVPVKVEVVEAAEKIEDKKPAPKKVVETKEDTKQNAE